MAPSVRLKGDYDSNRNKENTSLKKEKYLQRIQRYPEFSEKPIALITKRIAIRLFASLKTVTRGFTNTPF